MRDYLTDKVICGGLNVWREGRICRYTIENLIQHCDKIVIVMDKPDATTESIVKEYQEAYPDIIISGYTDFVEKTSNPMARWSLHEGDMRQRLFELMKPLNDLKPIDIILLPDSDEIFTYSLPAVLDKFVKSDRDTIFMKPIEVYDKMDVIISTGIAPHARIYKYKPDISALPYGLKNYYLPYRKNKKVFHSTAELVHLARLTPENRALRKSLRNRATDPLAKLWRVNKPAQWMTSEEYSRLLESDQFVYFKDYNGDAEAIPLTTL